MTTAIAIEDVRREVNILRALTGHRNLVHFYDAYEDEDNVYVVMEWVWRFWFLAMISYFILLDIYLFPLGVIQSCPTLGTS